ncbi:hypothetical protein [Beggiatoa leptomitoformis]|uniref:hypothetical protein n=1 Tax=Beggiatoa leptomitoformis TaxID=288004 RepID=UPI000AAF1079|nr:hypothetical protein [Beggiatoa leptomitoformis]QGX03755.1 hypothetical protein AL038_19220 [Beggiatoa leptomitoformis]
MNSPYQPFWVITYFAVLFGLLWSLPTIAIQPESNLNSQERRELPDFSAPDTAVTPITPVLPPLPALPPYLMMNRYLLFPVYL